jgi:hypothetical protein
MCSLITTASVAVSGAEVSSNDSSPTHLSVPTFGDDVAFLSAHTDILVLSDKKGVARVAIAPTWQGRVMTSTVDRDSGRSFGWINRPLISSGQVAPHINAFGGEDRLWLGPEGGQFSIFFAKGTEFNYTHWFVPEALDTRPFRIVSQSRDRASFEADFALTNYSGTRFQVTLRREVHLLESTVAWNDLGSPPSEHVSLVAYESRNTLVNTGKERWRKETGLLSIWILGMFSPSPTATIVVPIKSGSESELGTKVTSDYFGSIPSDRLKVTEGMIFLKGDGKFRSKVGINPRRGRGKLGSYDSDHRVLTIVQFDQPQGVNNYVNSLWKVQQDPYGGDVTNAYNDGPPAPGAKPIGPFFEMESSSPAAMLAPGASIEHTHRTIHLTGPESELDSVARAVLGVSLADIRAAFPGR